MKIIYNKLKTYDEKLKIMKNDKKKIMKIQINYKSLLKKESWWKILKR